MPQTPSPSSSHKNADLVYKADHAFEIRNYGYAAMLYHSILAMHPDRHEIRFKFHLAALKREETNPLPLWIKIPNAFWAIAYYALALWKIQKKDWLDACTTLEYCLYKFPRSTTLHWKNAECLELLDWAEAAMDEYRILRGIAPLDPQPLWELARLLSDESRWEETRDVYEAILKIRPDDPRVPSELRKIAAIHTLEKGGWQDTATYRDKIRDEKQARNLEHQEHLVKSSAEIEELLAGLQIKRTEAPNNIVVLREMARLLRLKGDLGGARDTLREALKISPNDYSMDRSLQEIELELMRLEIARLQSLGQKEAAMGLLQQYQRAHLEHKKAQVAQYPTNLLLRFELGEMFLAQGLIDEAVAEFQQAVKNPNKRLETQKLLGECFKRKNLYELAVEKLQDASTALQEMTLLKKEILYELASVYELMGKTEEAKKEYEKIYTVDISFKDVAKKIEGKTGK